MLRTPLKEGDLTIGVGAKDEATRKMPANFWQTPKSRISTSIPLLVDDLQKLIWETIDQAQYEKVKDWTMGELKTFLLTESEAEIQGIMYGLTSDTIGCIPKLMTNEELITLGQKIFNVTARHPDGGKRLYGCPHPAQFAHGPSG